MTYQQRWVLAVALKQPYPNLWETGDVTQPDPNTVSIDDVPANQGSTATQVQTVGNNIVRDFVRFTEVWHAAKPFIVGSAVLGIIVGGTAGYLVGKGKK